MKMSAPFRRDITVIPRKKAVKLATTFPPTPTIPPRPSLTCPQVVTPTRVATSLRWWRAHQSLYSRYKKQLPSGGKIDTSWKVPRKLSPKNKSFKNHIRGLQAATMSFEAIIKAAFGTTEHSQSRHPQERSKIWSNTYVAETFSFLKNCCSPQLFPPPITFNYIYISFHHLPVLLQSSAHHLQQSVCPLPPQPFPHQH